MCTHAAPVGGGTTKGFSSSNGLNISWAECVASIRVPWRTTTAGVDTHPSCHAECNAPRLGAEILSRIRRDPTLHFLQCRPANGSGLPFAAELHLATRPFEEHDELRCHFHGTLSTEILFHQCQG